MYAYVYITYVNNHYRHDYTYVIDIDPCAYVLVLSYVQVDTVSFTTKLMMRTKVHIFYMRTYVHTYIRIYIRTCIHTCIHAYTHTYIHTYIRMYRQNEYACACEFTIVSF